MLRRLFAAIKIEPDEHLLRHYYRLRKALSEDQIRWVEPGNMHLTLKFFGEIPEQQIEVISQTIRPLAAGLKAFPIKLYGAGIFGSRYKPRVIWFGVDSNGILEKLGKTMIKELDKAGFPEDRQNFVPHLTVGRIKLIRNKKHLQETLGKFQQAAIQQVWVKEIVLFESILKPDGPKYSARLRFPMNGMEPSGT